MRSCIHPFILEIFIELLFHAENLGTRDAAKSKAGNAPALVELTFFLQSQITASQQISK